MAGLNDGGVSARIHHSSHVRVVADIVRDLERARSSNRSGGPVVLDGQSLTIGALCAISRWDASVQLSDDPKVKDKIQRSIDVLNRLLQKGDIVYGVTTGYGGSADQQTREYFALQWGLINTLNAGFGESLSDEVVRGSMVIRANGLLKGQSAIRFEILSNLVKLLNAGLTPVVPLRGSVSASGDLIPLSYIAATLLGKDGLMVKSRGSGQQVPVKEALRQAGIQPVILQPKEGLALVNGTSVCNAQAALALLDSHVLTLLSQALTALCTEALLGTEHNYDPFIHAVARPHRGQVEVARNIAAMLVGSQLLRNNPKPSDELPTAKDATTVPKPLAALPQDRYALRTSPQWIGPQVEVLMSATVAVTIEMNSTTDNPLIDVENETHYHGGNFQGTAVAVAMENVRLCLASIGKLMFAQHSELVNKSLNRGLPSNLCWEEPSLDYGFKGVDLSMASYQAELEYLANPVTTHVQSAELQNQSVNSLALVSARYTGSAVSVLQMIMAAHLVALCQAIDLRNLQLNMQRIARDVVLNSLQQIVRACSRNGVSDDREMASFVRDHIHTFADNLEFGNEDSAPRFARFYSNFFNLLLVHIGNLDAETGAKYGSLQQLTSSFQKLIKLFTEQSVSQFSAMRSAYAPGSAAFLLAPGTRILYEWVRKELRVPIVLGSSGHIGADIATVHKAIVNGNVIAPLLRMFTAEDTKPVAHGFASKF